MKPEVNKDVAEQKIQELERLLTIAEANKTVVDYNNALNYWNANQEEISNSIRTAKVKTLKRRILALTEELKKEIPNFMVVEAKEQAKEESKKTYKKIILAGLGTVTLIASVGFLSKCSLDKEEENKNATQITKVTEEQVSDLMKDEYVIAKAVELLNAVRPYTAQVDGNMFYNTLLQINQNTVLKDKTFMARLNYGDAKAKEITLDTFKTFTNLSNAYSLMARNGEKQVDFSFLFMESEKDRQFIKDIEDYTYQIISISAKETISKEDSKLRDTATSKLKEMFEDVRFDELEYSNEAKLFGATLAMNAHATTLGFNKSYKIFESNVYNEYFDRIAECGETLENKDGKTILEQNYFEMDATTLADRLYENAEGKVLDFNTKDEIVEQIDAKLVAVKDFNEYAKEVTGNKDLPYLGSQSEGYDLSGIKAEGTNIGIENGVPHAEVQSPGTNVVDTKEEIKIDETKKDEVISEKVENVNGYDEEKGTVEVENPNTGEKTEVEVIPGTETETYDPDKAFKPEDFDPIPEAGTVEEESFEPVEQQSFESIEQQTSENQEIMCLQILKQNIMLAQALNKQNNGAYEVSLEEESIRLTFTM